MLFTLTRNLIALLALMCLVNTTLMAQIPADQEVVIIDGGIDNSGLLEQTINADTTDGGARTNPQRIYQLKKDEIYYMESRIQFSSAGDSTATLIIAGEEGGKKPVVLMSPVGGSGAFSNVIQGSLTLRNMYWPAKNIFGSGDVLFSLQGEGKQTLRVEDFVCEFAESGDIFVLRDVRGAANIFIKNSYFRNATQFANSFNFAVFARGDNGEPIDTMWIQNTTVANSGLTFFGKVNPTRFAFFDHNTIINTPKYLLFHDQFEESYWTNNLFVNCNWEGECQSTYETQLPDGVPSGIVNIDTIDADFWLPGHGYVPEMDDVKFLNSNNIHYTTPLLNTYYNGDFNDVGNFPISYRDWSPNVSAEDLPIPVTNVPIQYINPKSQALVDAYEGIIAQGNYDNTLDPMLVTPGMSEANIALFIKFAQSNYGVPGTPALTDEERAQMAFGDFDPTTIPGEEMESGTGISKISDFIEDFSYADPVRSDIDGLPIGSLMWWDGLTYDEDGALEAAVAFYENILTSVEDLDVFADSYQLKAYPNPLRNSTRIEFNLDRASEVRLSIYDGLGRAVTTLADQELNAGLQSFEWDASQHSSGMYYYVISVNGVSATGKLVLEK